MNTTISQPSETMIATIKGPMNEGFESILTDEALQFISSLHSKFNQTRLQLLEARQLKQENIDSGAFPDFLPQTKDIRESQWSVAPLPDDLKDRKVEITGPVDRKMVINALNCGAKVFMADFEDSHSPHWNETIKGQINLRDAVRRDMTFFDERKEKHYQLKADHKTTLMVRPRGFHLEEKHITIERESISASIFDFGLFFFHNAQYLIDHGSGPYFYLPKLESYLEAKLWNDIFLFSQSYLGIPAGTIKATVLIETILASFQMDEILYELRQHSAGLNCGRWDYIFSYIKKFRNHRAYLLPDRDQITMNAPFMNAYSQLLIQTCHKRQVHAMGGMAAQIPISSNPIAHKEAMSKVNADKLREVTLGHDGTWIAHPGLLKDTLEIFNQHMPNQNQINVKRDLVQITNADLLAVPEGTISEIGIRHNINIGIRYIESWLRGKGAVALNHIMEDAATAEISRAQLWQWIKNQAVTKEGTQITYEFCHKILTEESDQIRQKLGRTAFLESQYPHAAALMNQLIKEKEFTEFLTLPAYELITIK